MPQLSILKDELTDITTMKDISSALTEASAAKLKKIRDLFERNATFFQEIRHLYLLIHLNASRLDQQKIKEKAPQSAKKIRVAVSSNQRFYGNVNAEIMSTMLADLDREPTEALVIGITGIEYMKSSGLGNRFTSIIFAKDYPTTDEARRILEKLFSYTSVVVYYPKFVSLVSQAVGKVDISQWEAAETEVPEEERSILFEPEFPKIVAFFENQVKTLLFLRVMLESDLARTAARLLTMSSAEERADELIREKLTEIRRSKRSLINLQLLEMFSTMGQWKKE